MKKIGFLVTACLVACGLFLTQPAFATSTCEDLIYSDYSGCWTIGENDTLITFEVDTDNFGIYNFQSGESYSLLNGINYLTLTNGTFSLNNSEVDLGNSFGIYLNNDPLSEKGSNDLTVYDVYASSLGGYELDFGSSTTNLFINDAAVPCPPGQVPIPTAALLLGSGLAGLVGFRRKIGQH